jgi:adenylosuccinate synthase
MKGEITWEELSARLGKNMVPEKTTVTKKVRRIAEWDDELFEQSCLLNAPTQIALTFADYIDPAIEGATSMEQLKQSSKFMTFVMEHGLDNNTLAYVGTGPNTIVEVN